MEVMTSYLYIQKLSCRLFSAAWIVLLLSEVISSGDESTRRQSLTSDGTSAPTGQRQMDSAIDLPSSASNASSSQSLPEQPQSDAAMTFDQSGAARRSLRKAGSVGESRMMECEISYPRGRYVDYIITWRKHGVEVPVFIQFNGYPPHVDPSYQGRIRLVEQASIEISDLRLKDQGWYECSVVFLEGATEESTTEGTWIYLSVYAPPVLRYSASNEDEDWWKGQLFVRRLGDTVSFNCDVIAGIPFPSITWSVNGRDIPSPTSTEKPRRSAFLSASFAVDESNSAVGLTSTMTRSDDVKGSDNTAAAVAAGGGVGGRDSILEGKRVTVDGTHLTVRDLRPTDGGLYQCIAQNRVGQDEQVFRLVIEGHVYIMFGPQNKTAFEGTDVRFRCKADSFPPNITYRWFHLPMSPEASAIVWSKPQVLLEENFDDDDDDDDNGDADMVYDYDTADRRLEKVELETVTENGFLNARNWLRQNSMQKRSANGDQLSESKIWPTATAVNRMETFTDGTLLIRNVTPADMGWYSCRPSLHDERFTGDGDKDGHKSSDAQAVDDTPEASAFLNVTYVPRVIEMPPQVYLARGLPGRLDCQLDANPPATRITWSRNGRQLISATGSQNTVTSPPAVGRIQIGRRGSLLFRNVEMNDDGRYSCNGHSPVGTGNSSAAVHVIVREPPHFTARPNLMYQRLPGQSVTMPCQALADPTPNVAWRKVGGSLPELRSWLDGGTNLTIRNIQPYDQGVYECTATNAVASSVATTQLVIETIGVRSPSNVTVRTTSYSATVTWYPAFNSGHLLSYGLWYKSSQPHAPWRIVHLAPIDSTSVTVHGLRPNTDYFFVVLARSSKSTAPFANDVIELYSSIVNASTLDGTLSEPPSSEHAEMSPTSRDGYPALAGSDPLNSMYSQGWRPSGPTNMSAVLLPNGSVSISWTYDVMIGRHAVSGRTSKPILYNTVQYRTVGRWLPLAARLPADRKSYTWSTASRGTTYYFRVVGHVGPGSEEQTEPSATVALYTGDRFQGMSQTLAGGLIAIAAGATLLILLCFIFAVVSLRIVRRRRRDQAIKRATAKYFAGNPIILTTQSATPVTDVPLSTPCTSIDVQTNVVTVNQIPIIEVINVGLHETPI